MEQQNLLVLSIQRFCLHDGPGIRTTVFLKGCSLHCPWCANPESINAGIELYKDDDKCFFYGEMTTLQNVYIEILKDKKFYKTDGGVTFSGGEPLLQIENIKPLLEKLKKENINICMETALFVSEKKLKLALNYLDSIIIDIKILNDIGCKKNLGGDLKQYFKNIEIINRTSIPVTYRIPLIEPYISNDDNINDAIVFLKKNKYNSIELIEGHNLAEKKYKSLNKEMYKVPKLSDKRLSEIVSKFNENDISVSVMKV